MPTSVLASLRPKRSSKTLRDSRNACRNLRIYELSMKLSRRPGLRRLPKTTMLKRALLSPRLPLKPSGLLKFQF
jgi:hypothetical protein